MDNNIMLFEAAREGNLEVLYRVFQENPSILADIKLISLSESILHVAAKSGQLSFVHELMKLDPEMGRELNKDGFRALDIAVIMGKVEIVKTMLSLDHDLGRLRGRDNRSCLHYAAVKGRVEIIHELMSQCPDGIEDVTVHGDTALHLAVKYYQFDAFSELIEWVKRLKKMESIINVQDGDGNTVLHLAVSTKQYMCINLLLLEQGRVEVNLRNKKGLTALDVSDIVIQECDDGKIRQALQDMGATRSSDGSISQQPIIQNDEENNNDGVDHESKPKDYSGYFRFKMNRDSPNDTRNAMLVVTALVATITFQAAVNPPSGLYNVPSHGSNSTTQQPLGSTSFTTDHIFVFFNTTGFMGAIYIIYYLTSGFPLYRELYISLISMGCTYASSLRLVLGGVNVEQNVKNVAYVLVFIAMCLIYFIRLVPIWLQRAWNLCTGKTTTRNHGLPIHGN